VRNPRLARLEAVLFVAREPLNSRKLAQFAALLDGTEARTLVRRLNEQFDANGCAFRVEEVAGGFQLMTRAQFGSWLKRLVQMPIETRLSAPALETLSVVAYRQPVLRADVDAVRGVDCGEILRQLMERDLVRIAGRSDDLGRPYLYGTTKRFLQIFGLRHLEDLPRADILRAPQIPAELPSDAPSAERHEEIFFENNLVRPVEQA
jgi:segregation and condensation protein B